MKKDKESKKNKRRERNMEKVKAQSSIQELFNTLIEQSSNDWNELCENCTTLIKEAKMSNEDIDEIVERVRKENG